MEQIAKFERVTGYNDVILPKRATKGSAGYDFFAPEEVTLPCTIKTGVRVKINPGYVLCIFPRSGLGFKFGVKLANTVGVIDSDYYFAENEGHIIIKCEANENFVLKKGERFAQGIFLPFGITIDDEAEGKRTGGFGSTGS
ncbi:MAG: deoxyuridine 5'-triphosphate nucleotidohydrolase [Ruminococcus sp.]|jgi:dUTP pyrophosphatase|nr:deoxyuridine 5'-triphosphate nucleotidohydrolase [Ruminococcus sp.]